MNARQDRLLGCLGTVTLFTLAGCGVGLQSSGGALFAGGGAEGRQTDSSIARTAAFEQTKVPKGLLFVTIAPRPLHHLTSAVKIFDKNPPNALVGQITTGLSSPIGMAVDLAGDLFVANAAVPTIVEYPPGATKPSVTYRKDLTNPGIVAIGTDGTLYATNYYSIGNGSALIEYPPHDTKPSFKVRFTGLLAGLTLDSKNNLYVGYNGPTGGRILRFVPGSKVGEDLGIAIGFVGGLAFDAAGDLVVCDQTAPAIDVFPPGATQPSQRITAGLSDPSAIAFGHDYRRLYVADSAAGNVLDYAYPEGTIVTQFNLGAAFGVALSPPAPM
ncbi:MAG: hypothetical protein ABI202_03085 [Candidatus Baltobacteraceae bacterium]